MSKNHHAAVEAVETILYDYNHMTLDDFEFQYGVKIQPDGTVYDSTYHRTFDTLADWVDFEGKQQELEMDQFHTSQSLHDYDEY